MGKDGTITDKYFWLFMLCSMTPVILVAIVTWKFPSIPGLFIYIMFVAIWNVKAVRPMAKYFVDMKYKNMDKNGQF